MVSNQINFWWNAKVVHMLRYLIQLDSYMLDDDEYGDEDDGERRKISRTAGAFSKKAYLTIHVSLEILNRCSYICCAIFQMFSSDIELIHQT